MLTFPSLTRFLQATDADAQSTTTLSLAPAATHKYQTGTTGTRDLVAESRNLALARRLWVATPLPRPSASFVSAARAQGLIIDIPQAAEPHFSFAFGQGRLAVASDPERVFHLIRLARAYSPNDASGYHRDFLRLQARREDARHGRPGVSWDVAIKGLAAEERVSLSGWLLENGIDVSVIHSAARELLIQWEDLRPGDAVTVNVVTPSGRQTVRGRFLDCLENPGRGIGMNVEPLNGAPSRFVALSEIDPTSFRATPHQKALTPARLKELLALAEEFSRLYARTPISDSVLDWSIARQWQRLANANPTYEDQIIAVRDAFRLADQAYEQNRARVHAALARPDEATLAEYERVLVRVALARLMSEATANLLAVDSAQIRRAYDAVKNQVQCDLLPAQPGLHVRDGALALLLAGHLSLDD